MGPRSLALRTCPYRHCGHRRHQPQQFRRKFHRRLRDHPKPHGPHSNTGGNGRFGTLGFCSSGLGFGFGGAGLFVSSFDMNSDGCRVRSISAARVAALLSDANPAVPAIMTMPNILEESFM
jgi:hypothetical protein